MEGKFWKKLLNKFDRKPKVDPSINEYAFNLTDLKELGKENNEKIKELKRGISEQVKKKEVLDEKRLDDSILNQDNSLESEDDALEKRQQEEVVEPENSFIHLSEKNQDLIMEMWKEIDFSLVDRDIIKGKDLINHNYTITYADKANKYIKEIRKRYDLVLCYLIGFNNEKKGIYDKTSFSDDLEDEWKYLNYYIKLLEKIRSFKGHE